MTFTTAQRAAIFDGARQKRALNLIDHKGNQTVVHVNPVPDFNHFLDILVVNEHGVFVSFFRVRLIGGQFDRVPLF